MNYWALLALALVLIPYWMVCRWVVRVLILMALQKGAVNEIEKILGGLKK